MVGPLPRLHRIVVVVAVLLTCAALGAWLGTGPSIPLLVGTGLVGGALVGAVAAYALLHQPHAHGTRPRQRHR